MPSRSDVTDSCSGREPSEPTSLVESRRAFGLWLGGLLGAAALWGCTESGTSSGGAVVSLLDAVPGQTTLDEFRKQFHVIGVRDNSAAGVVSARAGAAANLDLGPLKLAELTGVFVDGRLFELHGWVRGQDSGRFQELMSSRYGTPVVAEGMSRWSTANSMVMHKREETGPERFVVSYRPLTATAMDRGYDGVLR